MTEANKLQKKANICFLVILALYAVLVLSLLVKIWWFNPPLIISIFQVFPLLIPLPWVLKRGLRAISWLCFILCFYFITGVLDAWSRPEQIYGWVTTFSSVLLFISSMMFIRWQARAYKTGLPE